MAGKSAKRGRVVFLSCPSPRPRLPEAADRNARSPACVRGRRVTSATARAPRGASRSTAPRPFSNLTPSWRQCHSRRAMDNKKEGRSRMAKAFIFPGQGSQAVGMGKALAEAFPSARAVFDEVDSALAQPLSKLMFEGPEAELTLTANAQPALMAVSLAAIRVLETECGPRPRARRGVRRRPFARRIFRARRRRGPFLADTARLLRIRGDADAESRSGRGRRHGGAARRRTRPGAATSPPRRVARRRSARSPTTMAAGRW